jgi:hypothetical protein
MTYYTAVNEDLDDLRPMTREETIEAYRQIIEEEPQALADLYIDFYDFRRIEFLIFKNRLSSAVLIANSAEHRIGQLASKLETRQQDGSYIVPGWEAESGDVLSESLGVTNAARNISIGATIVTAVAALEGLLIDLAPKSEPRPKGLYQLLQAFLRRYAVLEPAKTEIMEMGKKVRDRRNTFAHSLTGSYWETDPSITAMFTSETMEDTLYTVGRIAVLMEEIVLA